MTDETEIVYMLVPYKPTPEMLKAGGEWSVLPEQTWQDMLDASPEIDREEGGSEVKSLPTQADIANALIDSGINEKISVVEIEALLAALDARSPSTAVRAALTNTSGADEAYGYIFQHEETGLQQVVDVQQVEWGFEKNNPRWQKIGPVYARPQSAAVRDEDWKDAERFRALMRCGRIKMQGSSGVDPKTGERNGNNVHFGAEFWPEPIPEGYEEHYGASTKWGRACIKALADAVLEDEASRALHSTQEG